MAVQAVGYFPRHEFEAFIAIRPENRGIFFFELLEIDQITDFLLPRLWGVACVMYLKRA